MGACISITIAAALCRTSCLHACKNISRLRSHHGRVVGDLRAATHAHNSWVMCRCLVQRRLRILTVPVEVASSARDVFDHADPDAIIAILTHKVALATQVCGSRLPTSR